MSLRKQTGVLEVSAAQESNTNSIRYKSRDILFVKESVVVNCFHLKKMGACNYLVVKPLLLTPTFITVSY